MSLYLIIVSSDDLGMRCAADLVILNAEQSSIEKTDPSLTYPSSIISAENSIDCAPDVAIIEQIVNDFPDGLAPAACAPISRLT
jgi:hypothetical protein